MTPVRFERRWDWVRAKELESLRSKLLKLARINEASPELVPAARAFRESARMLRGLPRVRKRHGRGPR